jgi:hypothetical protein
LGADGRYLVLHHRAGDAVAFDSSSADRRLGFRVRVRV